MNIVRPVFPLLADKLEILVHKKPDIHVTDHLLKEWFLVKITVCYDLYLKYAYNTKVEKYKPLVDCLTKNGYDVEMLVICFGSLGSVRNDAWKCLRKFSKDKIYIKEVLKWCSISSIIGSNRFLIYLCLTSLLFKIISKVEMLFTS